ncbi:MAG: ATP-dependent zinc protease [Magnetococcales bacterium]|nr:ATP-dependent zinc protease [Magnetococcales bacterium]
MRILKPRASLLPERPVLGWREWVGLPDFGVERIKTKIDTGARTSALHALEPTQFVRDGKSLVQFRLHPVQRKSKPELLCEAPLVDCRSVISSGGHIEHRFVILTQILLGERLILAEVTLTNRTLMGFRMLVGRTTIGRKFLVDPGRSFLTTRHKTGETP